MLFGGGIILTIGDIIATEWVRVEGGLFLYLLTMVFYVIGMAILIKSYEREDIPVASVIMVVFNVIILTIVGVTIFQEEITISKVVGILLGFISLMLLEFGKEKIFVSK